jgi:hypothetical protein
LKFGRQANCHILLRHDQNAPIIELDANYGVVNTSASYESNKVSAIKELAGHAGGHSFAHRHGNIAPLTSFCSSNFLLHLRPRPFVGQTVQRQMVKQSNGPTD